MDRGARIIGDSDRSDTDTALELLKKAGGHVKSPLSCKSGMSVAGAQICSLVLRPAARGASLRPDTLHLCLPACQVR